MAAQEAASGVAAYCRVSTDNEGQMSSLELQMAAFRTQIELRPDWELVDIYADEGISGTRAEKRPEFQRMIRDCEAGKIDYIITKSISRFARNTLECLQHIRYLQSLGVQLLFEKENIDTGTAFSEMLLTILAAFAQEESRSLSENAKWGIRKRFEAGIPKRTYVFGYTYDAEGNYVVVPEQAETVRRIFDLYETGRYSMAKIAKQMMEEKRPSAYVDNWDASHVHCILTNEKYVGDVLMQKKYTVDHLTHKEVKNRDHVLPSYYVRDHHTPIVGRKQYDRVHKIAELKSSHGHPVQYPYGDLLVCPVCGGTPAAAPNGRAGLPRGVALRPKRAILRTVCVEVEDSGHGHAGSIPAYGCEAGKAEAERGSAGTGGDEAEASALQAGGLLLAG